MLEIKNEEGEAVIENNNLPSEAATKDEADAPPETTTASEQPELETAQPPQTEECTETTATAVAATLNPLNSEPESHNDIEAKGKQRRYWTPKEEERFFEIWGRENWHLTRHGKNTIFFAQWSEELKERFNIDVKPEEIQCKVNQTRAKFRSVKKLLESGKPVQKWKKYDLVEKILKNQYRSKDDDPVPLDALENNRDMSPTELLNCETRPSSPNGGVTAADQDINLSQTPSDPQLADEVNMSNISLSDQNLTSHVFSNNSQSSTSFSTELFGSDQLDIKKEIETDLMQEGFSEFISTEPNAADSAANNATTPVNETQSQQPMSMVQQPLPPPPPPQQPQTTMMAQQQNLLDISNNVDVQQQLASALNNNRTIPNSSNINNTTISTNSSNINTNSNTAAATLLQNHQNPIAPMLNNYENALGTALNQNHIVMPNNHAIGGTMQPPKNTMPMIPTPSPRKRNASSKAQSMPSVCGLSQDALENLYLEELKKKNVILVEQGEINRKRLRLEEKKVKLMEEFFPKYLTLQQEILQKLEGVTSAAAAESTINVKMED